MLISSVPVHDQSVSDALCSGEESLRQIELLGREQRRELRMVLDARGYCFHSKKIFSFCNHHLTSLNEKGGYI